MQPTDIRPTHDRRRVIGIATGLVVAEAAGILTPAAAAGRRGDEPAARVEPVTPPEDLMREHGVLDRVLLIYEAAMRKIADGHTFDPAIISGSAQVVRQFIESYHEWNEETQLFPRFRKAGQMVDLVNVLYQQHQAGRRLTDTILGLAPGLGQDDDPRPLVETLEAFVRMYRPHEAREDTELFPKLRAVVSAHEFAAMAEDFERDERRKFGQDGFAMMVQRVADLERAIGIDDLSKFTPV
jgi:hemerythrin-like domain-containing protein